MIAPIERIHVAIKSKARPLYAVLCEDESVFIYAGEKGVYTNPEKARQVAESADQDGRHVCRCRHHRVVAYVPVRKREE